MILTPPKTTPEGRGEVILTSPKNLRLRCLDQALGGHRLLDLRALSDPRHVGLDVGPGREIDVLVVAPAEHGEVMRDP